MKKGKPFYFRIDLIDLMDFATEPAGLSMTLLEFAKELKRGESTHHQIQKIIDEASNYIEKKKNAGKSGGIAKASSAKAVLEMAEENCSSAIAEASRPLASNRSSNSNNTETEIKDLKPTPLKSQMFEICKAWKAFIEMRKFIRKPLTNYAMDLTCKTLEKLQREGHDPIAVLNKSVENNWQGVFALEEKTNGNGTARSTGTTGKKTGLIEANGAGTDFLS